MAVYEIEWSEHADWLGVQAENDADWYTAVARALARPADRLVLDVGCGGAGMAAALSRVLTGGRVIGVDGDAEVLREAARRCAGLEIGFVKANLDDGAVALREAIGDDADLVWAASAVHHAADQQAAVNALTSLLAPSGRLALAEGGLPTRCLPWDVGVGEPGLEVRLDAAQDTWFAGMRAGLTGSVRMPYGWTEALRRAGLQAVTTRTIMREEPMPLSPAAKERIVESLRHRTQRLDSTGLLDGADAIAWRQLLDPSSDSFLGRRSDLQRISATSIHIGHRSES